MEQLLIIEISEKDYLEELNTKLKEGYKVIVGSTYIKSLFTDIVLDNGTILEDIDHVFTLAVNSTNDFVFFSKNHELFRKEVNALVKNKLNKIVVGSLSIDLVHLDFYTECKRVYMTYYCCALYKD